MRLFVKKTLILCVFILCFSPWIEAGDLKRKVKDIVEDAVTPNTPTPPDVEVDPDSSDILVSDNAYEQCRATVLPSFINNSMSWGPAKFKKKIGPIKSSVETGLVTYRAYDSLSPPAVMVVAAGNNYPSPLNPLKVKASKDKNFNAILVGSLDPHGKESRFSQKGEEVHISAPSNYQITSSTNDGRYRKFGGTSGATPLVTGGLASFEWLAGYHPTAEESKILLEKTAIKTPISNQKPRKSGAGMLNSYKMAMVGEELKRLCGKNISCFKKNIKNPAIYTFPEDPGLKEEVERAFPECSSSCGGTEESCKDKAFVFKKLRKAAFLNPSNRVNWRQLACIHKRSGLSENAKGFSNIYKSLTAHSFKSTCGSDSDCVLVPDCDGSASRSRPLLRSMERTKLGSAPPEEKKQKGEVSFLSMGKAEAETYKLEKCSREQICKYPPDIHGGPHQKRVEGEEYRARCLNSSCIVQSGVMDPVPPSLSPTEGGGPSVPVPKEEATPSGSSGRR